MRAGGRTSKGPRVPKPKVIVCPICWRKSCPLFVRLEGHKFTDDEKTRFFTAFHRDVCDGCKKLTCIKDSGGEVPLCQPRKFSKLHVLPAWWLKGQHN